MSDEKKFFELKLKDTDSMARRGTISLPGATIETPVFMPVGTQATVKGMTPHDISNMGYGIILCNSYHLYLRPGTEVIGNLGGLHRFMAWDKCILTDSGGFQVFSLRDRLTINADGVEFRSHIDGSKHFFTPESVVRMQEIFGSDIIMPLDECVPADAPRDYVKESLKKTHLWAKRSKDSKKSRQILFGIVQGGIFTDLREESVKAISELDLPGFSIGGLSVGESKDIMHEVLEKTTPLIPDGKPRYLMGVGAPEDLFEGVARGIDMFDCVLPTRMGRTGTFLTGAGRLVIKNACHKLDHEPVDSKCACYTCRNFSRAYLRHLFMSDEMLGPQLASHHNLHFLFMLMKNMREAIEKQRFIRFKEDFFRNYNLKSDCNSN